MAKILLIDDDPLLVRMYQHKFELDGFEIITANNGEDGWTQILETHPDLILLDVMMPRLSGLDLLKRIKQTPETKNIPVIMLSNVSSSEGDIEVGLELGAVTYLVKSNYTPKEVVQKIKEILSGYSNS